MILCSCAVLTDKELARVVAAMFAEDPQTVVTPGSVFHRLGKRIVCGGCGPLVVEAIAQAVAAHQQSQPQTAPRSRP